MIDQDYVKNMQAWVTSMDVTNEQTKTYIAFHEKEIELHSKLLSLYKEMLEHDEQRLEKAKEDFDKYVVENNR
jgi:hypothetical protein